MTCSQTPLRFLPLHHKDMRPCLTISTKHIPVTNKHLFKHLCGCLTSSQSEQTKVTMPLISISTRHVPNIHLPFISPIFPHFASPHTAPFGLPTSLHSHAWGSSWKLTVGWGGQTNRTAESRALCSAVVEPTLLIPECHWKSGLKQLQLGERGHRR